MQCSAIDGAVYYDADATDRHSVLSKQAKRWAWHGNKLDFNIFCGGAGRKVGDLVAGTVAAYMGKGPQATGLREYIEFWTHITVDRITELVAEIVEKLVDLDRPERKSRVPQGRKDAALKALVHTLNYVHLFLRVNYPSARFERAKKLWADKDKHVGMMNSSPALTRAKEVMRNMLLHQADPTNHLVRYALIDILTPGRESVSSSINSISSMGSSEAFSSPFMFAYIRYFLHQPDISHTGAMVYEAVEVSAIGVINAARKTPLLFELTMLNILFVLKELVILWPVETALAPRLENLSAHIRETVLLWPKPFCTFAQDVLSQIAAELANPGVHLRQRLLEENPFLLPQGAADPSLQRDLQTSQKAAEVIAVVDDLSSNGNLLLRACRCMTRTAERPRIDAVELTRRDILVNLLSYTFMYPPGFDAGKLVSFVDRLSDDEVDEALVTLAAPDQDARRLGDDETLADVDARMQSVAEARWESLAGSPLEELQQQTHRVWGKVNGESNFACWLQVPECNFDLHSFDAMIEHQVAPRWDMGRRLLCLGTNRCVQEVLRSFHTPSSQLGSQGNLSGGPRKIFLAPGLSHNDLCAFLASRDGWYRKHVYAPFCAGLALCPGVEDTYQTSRRRRSVSSDTSDLEIDGTVSPLQRTIALLSDYVQGAQEECAIQMFEVQGFADKSASSQPVEVAPFVCRIEIGLGAAAQAHCNVASGRDRDRVRSVSTSSVSSSASSVSSGFFISSQQQHQLQHQTSQPPPSPSSFLTPSQHQEFATQGQDPQQDPSGSVSASTGGFGPGSSTSPIMSSAHANVVAREPCVWDEAILDKRFTRASVGPGVTPTIQVSMKGVKLDGTPVSKSKMLPPSEYLSLVLANCPAYASSTMEGMTLAPLPYLRHLAQANPLDPWLHVSWIEQRNSVQYLHDLIRKRDKKSKELDALADALVREYESFHAHSVEIISEREPFYICVDGNLRGPFYRIKVSPARNKLPVQTFLPIKR
ncbi:Hypothetical Protein FCC1311_014832 [Hondaea fermentalgiana]|uniref:Uncharacterized protein n=1 Tax=Hondaea fermentalgiana TaxID=2315210 RepID=A0A2R5G2L8_9STRA|nr:Hypothetical Protein FCC1311_014832 [Hondaea fermentalgiana]|eukprot:GBG25266.1 Hypothetical Protein FCC1311_014832 [Hondaea fermentalgiana]